MLVSIHNKTLRFKGGFTLIEALIATILIGVAISAILTSSASLSNVNAAGVDLSTAEFLIGEFQERSASVAFADLSALGGTYSPAEDIYGNALSGFDGFSQVVTVLNVRASDLSTAEAGSDFIRITVKLLRNGSEISSANWIRTRL